MLDDQRLAGKQPHRPASLVVCHAIFAPEKAVDIGLETLRHDSIFLTEVGITTPGIAVTGNLVAAMQRTLRSPRCRSTFPH